MKKGLKKVIGFGDEWGNDDCPGDDGEYRWRYGTC